MKLIRSQLLSLDYDPETNTFSFKKEVLGKKTCTKTRPCQPDSKKRLMSKPEEKLSGKDKHVKTVVLTNYHSKTYRKHKHDDGDSCESWKFLCSCEIIRKAWSKDSEPKHEDKHKI